MNNKTIDFFKEISKIPRESGNEEEISNYIVKFAKKRNLEYIKDEFNNVIIKKYHNDDEPVILQAHLDMVCEKEKDIEFDFAKGEIELIFEDDYIKANKTTLGADNGIGVAQILNILDSDIKTNIEAIFTTCEETTMSGASGIDLSELKGKTMINLDGFDSDTILIESAAFTDIDIVMGYCFKTKTFNNLYKIKLSGLEGGHSGFDIDKNRGNAIILLAKLLMKFNNVRLASFNGGTKINVIPYTAEAIFETSEDVCSVVNLYKKELLENYKNINIEIDSIPLEKFVLSSDDTNKFLTSISSFNHGVICRNYKGEVTTSQNLALVDLTNNLVQIGLRSSILDEEEKAINYLKNYCDNYNYNLNILGHQPGFSTDENSKLVNKMKEAYYKVNNSFPITKSVHISVEVGLIKEKIKDLEVVIISPLIIEAHTPREKVKISSVELCDKWLYEFLNQK